MIYALKLGPLETGEGPCHVYVGVRDDGFLVRPVFGRSDKAALRELAAESPGETLRCEKRLARAGGALGYEAAPMPLWVPVPRANLALALALGPGMVPAHPDALMMLCQGAAEFLQGAPWRYWHDGDAIEVVLTGATQATFEASLMGNAGMEYGVALYRRAGALRRIADSVDRGDLAAAAEEDALAVTLDDEPRFAITALGDAYGLTRLPVPMKLERGGTQPMDGEDLAILGGTLRLLATMTPQRRDASLVIESGDEEITVAITMPPASSPDPRPTRARAKRPARRKGPQLH